MNKMREASLQVHLKVELNPSCSRTINQASRQPNTVEVTEWIRITLSQLTRRAALIHMLRDKIRSILKAGSHKSFPISLTAMPTATKNQRRWIQDSLNWSHRIETSHIRRYPIRNWPESNVITTITRWIKLMITKKTERKITTTRCRKRLTR